MTSTILNLVADFYVETGPFEATNGKKLSVTAES